MAWSKVKFYWDMILGKGGNVLTASSTASGYNVANIHNRFEINAWKATASAGTHYILLDTGTGDVPTAVDYFIMGGHNLGTANATIALQWSDDNSAFTNIFSTQPLNDGVFLREFTELAHRYYRIVITGCTQAPEITHAWWGKKTELDYASTGFDPYAEEVKASVNTSYAGYVTGIHTQYTERSIDLKFDDCSETEGTRYLADGTYTAGGSITAIGATITPLYEKIKRWWDYNGLKNFYVAWERTNSPDDIYLTRSDTKFSNPLKAGGAYRDIAISLTGRKA
ncbi:MAG: hypothetical protein AABZ23_06405 [Deltaproteobacteria bacterium]